MTGRAPQMAGGGVARTARRGLPRTCSRSAHSALAFSAMGLRCGQQVPPRAPQGFAELGMAALPLRSPPSVPCLAQRLSNPPSALPPSAAAGSPKEEVRTEPPCRGSFLSGLRSTCLSWELRVRTAQEASETRRENNPSLPILNSASPGDRLYQFPAAPSPVSTPPQTKVSIQ